MIFLIPLQSVLSLQALNKYKYSIHFQFGTKYEKGIIIQDMQLLQHERTPHKLLFGAI